MGDIALILADDINTGFDIEIKNGDLSGDEGLETAVAISLFTDRRVTDEDLPPGTKDKKGWWGDMFPETDQDKIGSRLWLLARSKRTTEVLRKAEDYAKEALNWMIEDGVATSIIATASYNESKFLLLAIEIVKPKGRTSKFQVLWEKQEIKRG